jgi:hypothetical protein
MSINPRPKDWSVAESRVGLREGTIEVKVCVVYILIYINVSLTRFSKKRSFNFEM